MRFTAALAALVLMLAGAAGAVAPLAWQPSTSIALQAVDDDVARHVAQPDYFAGLEVSTLRFTENGFDWQLVRWTNPAKPDGPLWVVPHDDEDGAFDAMIAALREYGGVGIAVNSTGARRMQSGRGRCGVRSAAVSDCDPNRNFAPTSPLYVAAFLDQRRGGQPVIALHTNRPGFAGDGRGGSGDITVVDAPAYRRGVVEPRSWALLATAPTAEMANYDTFGLAPFAASARRPSEADDRCGAAMAQGGISFWHERVVRSDGSLSNYIVLYRPEIAYFNAESRAESDPGVAASRHGRMITAYLERCAVAPPPATIAIPVAR